MSDKPEIPNDLYPQRAGHGYDAGCECDLEGGDRDCQIQPPFESTNSYCTRLRGRIITAEATVAQQAATISTVTEFLKAIVIAFKEPDGGPYFKLRAFAESKGIYADDLGRDRVMLRIAQAALDCIPREDKP